MADHCDAQDLVASHLAKGGQFWVVEATPPAGGSGRVEYAGCIGCKRVDGRLAELHRLSVRPEHRRRGLARKLCLTVERWVEEHGFVALFMTTWPVRRPRNHHSLCSKTAVIARCACSITAVNTSTSCQDNFMHSW